jgi:hypothetical protein
MNIKHQQPTKPQQQSNKIFSTQGNDITTNIGSHKGWLPSSAEHKPTMIDCSGLQFAVQVMCGFHVISLLRELQANTRITRMCMIKKELHLRGSFMICALHMFIYVFQISNVKTKENFLFK